MHENQNWLEERLMALRAGRGELGTNRRLKLDPWQSTMREDRRNAGQSQVL